MKGRKRVFMRDPEKKRKKEVRMSEEMIRLYCRRHHGNSRPGGEELCPECRALADYARQRIGKCPFMENKTFCSSCRVHCYRPQMREKIRTVMRYSGPRMLVYHPVTAVHHVICQVRDLLKQTHTNWERNIAGDD